MRMYPFRIFTLDDANETLDEVAEVTRATQERLDTLRAAYRDASSEEDSELEDRTREALNEWARSILELGAQPKGIFTVDFRSPDPNVLWCWAPDESRINHRHFTWESFKDRVELEAVSSSWLSLN